MIMATGTTGTLGRHLSNLVQPINLDLRSDFNLRDITNTEKMLGIIHMAGIVGNSAVEANLSISHEVNVIGTEKLGTQILESGVTRFIYVSSSHVYKPSVSLLFEDSDIGPITSYGSQKLEAEEHLRQIFINEPERLCLVRVFSVLDWDMPKDSLGGAARRLLATHGQSTIANSDDRRDFLSPSQVSAALLTIAKTPSMHGTYNLCSGSVRTVGSAIQRMFEQFPEVDLSESLIPGTSSNPMISGSNSKLLEAIPNLDLIWIPGLLN